MQSIKETDIQKGVCDYLALRKHFFWRSNNMPVYDSVRKSYRALPKYAKHGIPDIIVIKDGFFIGLEIKKKGGYQSKEQKLFEKELKEAGGEYWVIRDIDQLKEIGL
jgi:hypothetical protein